MAIVFVFLDGFGLGAADERNPLWAYPAPFLRRLLGGPLAGRLNVAEPRLLARGIDATLGVAGAPQSATGQTALFTGVNAPALVGEHLPAFPNGQLKEIIAEYSILKRAAEHGRRATFANAYGALYWETVARRRLPHSASTLTNLAAGLPFRTFDDLAAGRAVYWDITHSTLPLRLGREAARPYSYRRPEDAGRVLAGLARQHDLVLYECFLPDMVGHQRLPHTPRWTVYVLDRFLEGLIGALGSNDSLVLSSDHGNFEDSSEHLHTRNPVPLLVVGPAAPRFAGAARITDVTPTILAFLDDAEASNPC